MTIPEVDTPDDGLRFADHIEAEVVEVSDRLMTVYIVDGVSYPTKKGAGRAFRKARDRWLNKQASHRIAPPKVSEEYRNAYQVVIEGEIIKEFPTAQMAEEKVRALRNAQDKEIRNTLALFGLNRNIVAENMPDFAQLLKLYTAEDLRYAHRVFKDSTKRVSPDAQDFFEEVLSGVCGDKYFHEAAAEKFLSELCSKARLLREELGTEDTGVIPPLEMAVHLVDCENLIDREMLEQIAKRIHLEYAIDISAYTASKLEVN